MWWRCPRIISVCQSFYVDDEHTMRWCWQHLGKEVECEECGDVQECLEYVNLLMLETKISQNLWREGKHGWNGGVQEQLEFVNLSMSETKILCDAVANLRREV